MFYFFKGVIDNKMDTQDVEGSAIKNTQHRYPKSISIIFRIDIRIL